MSRSIQVMLIVLVAAIALAASSQTASATLIGQWTLDDISGTNVPDSAGGDNTGTMVNTTVVASSAPVPSGTTSAVNFNDAADRINLTNTTGNLSPGTGDWSFAAWIKPTSVGSETQGLYEDSGAGYVLFRLNYDEIQTYVVPSEGGSYGTFLSTDANLAAGVWTHVAMIRSGTSLTGYVNGVAKASTTLPAGYNLNAGGTPTLGFGNGDAYSGDMDEVRIYNHALSSSELMGLVVPEPAGLALLATGLLALLAYAWRKRR